MDCFKTWYASPSLPLGSGVANFGFLEELLGWLQVRPTELEVVLVTLPTS
jgi:hypothetical protein